MKIKPRYKVEFKVWVQDEDNIVEIDDKIQTLLLPSIHEDYLKLKAIPGLQKHYHDKKVIHYKLIGYTNKK